MFSSLGVFVTIKSRRRRLAGLVACIEKKINTYRIWVRESYGKTPNKNVGVRCKIILNWTLTYLLT